MKKKDEILIQQKIDGQLRPAEEAKFNQLIAKSGKAKTLYERLLAVDLAIKNDSKNINETDLSDSILETINNNKNLKTLKFRKINHELLKYAAILILGILLGGTAGIMFIGNNEQIYKDSISGTITKNIQESKVFTDENTTIEVQGVNLDNSTVTFVAIETSKTIECIIANNNKTISINDVKPLINDTNIELAEENKNSFKYIVNGPVVFQIKNNSNKALEICFIHDNKILVKKNVY
ncbi:MAG: hypothetical protein JW798_15435 [Prolixibacteraceae bacterium]|nr:hypothetical protein [Prolixibacteraceae bacterium]